MRYKYTITKEGGETEEMEEMGWKKLFKKLLEKYPKFSGWCSYFNKHGNMQVRGIYEWEGDKKMNYGECQTCGCTPKPDEWSSLIPNCCFDCA